MATRTISICLPEEILQLLERFKANRNDASMSNIVRYLCLRSLAEMSYLPDEQKKALGATTMGEKT